MSLPQKQKLSKGAYCYPNCGTQQVSASFERKNSRQTLRFEGIAMLLVKDCPVSTVASHMGCNEKTIVKIMKYWRRYSKSGN